MNCGHGLVVEHVLAKDETRVRFSLAAQHLSFCKTLYIQGFYSKLWITMLVMFIKDIVGNCLFVPFFFKIRCKIKIF
jgi:hypothetical protein